MTHELKTAVFAPIAHALRRGLLPLVMLAMLATACGPSDGPTATTASPRPLLLRRGLGAEPATLDPRLAADNAALAIAADRFEGLTTNGADGSPVAGAAASWEASPDELSYTFHLRPGLRWSNGDPLTAEHFAAALRWLVGPSSTAPNAGLYDALQHVEAVDERTLRVTLRQRLPHLPALLALPAAAPRHPSPDDAGNGPGNGAFRLEQRSVGHSVTLQRNPHYWDASNVALERVVYLTVAELGTELNLYRTGQLDITSEVPNTHVATLRRELPGELRITPYLGVYSYAVNLARLPDRDVRQALALAIDRGRITRQVTGAGETPAFGWTPDGIPGYQPARFEWQALPHDEAVRRARESWINARARGAAPESLTLCTDASTNHHRTAVALADLWHTALGVEATIVELEWTVYLDTRRNPGQCDLVRFGWSADFVDPEAFATLFETSHPQNTLGYSSARYDELLEQSRMASTSVERMALIAAAEAQLLEDVPVIPIFFRVSKRLVKPHVTGVGTNPLGQLPSRSLGLRQP